MRDSEIKVIYCATEKQINQLLEQESWRVVSSSVYVTKDSEGFEDVDLCVVLARAQVE